MSHNPSFPPGNRTSEDVLNEEMQSLKDNFDMFFLIVNGLFVFCKFAIVMVIQFSTISLPTKVGSHWFSITSCNSLLRVLMRPSQEHHQCSVPQLFRCV